MSKLWMLTQECTHFDVPQFFTFFLQKKGLGRGGDCLRIFCFWQRNCLVPICLVNSHLGEWWEVAREWRHHVHPQGAEVGPFPGDCHNSGKVQEGAEGYHVVDLPGVFSHVNGWAGAYVVCFLVFFC